MTEILCCYANDLLTCHCLCLMCQRSSQLAVVPIAKVDTFMRRSSSEGGIAGSASSSPRGDSPAALLALDDIAGNGALR
jgi:hypothetical protein